MCLGGISLLFLIVSWVGTAVFEIFFKGKKYKDKTDENPKK